MHICVLFKSHIGPCEDIQRITLDASRFTAIADQTASTAAQDGVSMHVASSSQDGAVSSAADGAQHVNDCFPPVRGVSDVTGAYLPYSCDVVDRVESEQLSPTMVRACMPAEKPYGNNQVWNAEPTRTKSSNLWWEYMQASRDHCASEEPCMLTAACRAYAQKEL